MHRDIKPGNLLLDGRERLAVADFGIARLAWEDQLTATGQVLGTAAYLSPEQALGEAATAASDRYALAVVAYELLTGTRPFEAEHFAAQARAHVEDPVPPASSRAVVDLSKAVDAVLERGLAKDPDDRWGSAEEFVAALERTLSAARADEADAQAGAAREAAAARALRPRRREPERPRDADTRRVRRRPPAAARGAGAARGRRCAGRRAGREARRGAAARRRSAAPLLLGLAALALLAVIGAIALANRGDDDPRRGREHARGDRVARAHGGADGGADRGADGGTDRGRRPTEPDGGADRRRPTPEPTQTAEPSGEPDLKRAQALQLEGYNARRAGDFQTALASAPTRRCEACGGSRELSPCGFALFEQGAALTRSASTTRRSRPCSSASTSTATTRAARSPRSSRRPSKAARPAKAERRGRYFSDAPAPA